MYINLREKKPVVAFAYIHIRSPKQHHDTDLPSLIFFDILKNVSHKIVYLTSAIVKEPSDQWQAAVPLQ